MPGMNGQGALAATADGKLTSKGATIDGALAQYQDKAVMDDPYCNWQVMHDEPFTAYYLYNIGAKKFLNTKAEGGLSDEPQALLPRQWGKGFYISVEDSKEIIGFDPTTAELLTLDSRTSNRNFFYVYDNFRMIQPVAVADSLRQYTEPGDKLALYKAGIGEMLNAPVGVVGGFASEDARETLQAAYDNADSDPMAFIEAVENVDVLEFDPDNTVYRFASTDESLASTPYISADEALRIYAKADSKGPDQIWRFEKKNDGYTISSQGVTLKPMGNRVGETISSTSNYNLGGIFTLSQPSWGKNYIAASEFAAAVVNGANSPIKSAAPEAEGSTWYVEPAQTASFSLNSVGVTSVFFDYTIILPGNVNAYGVSGVNSDGTLQLISLGDTIPARTGAIIVGDNYQKVTVEVSGADVPAKEGNLLKGVFFRNTSLVKGTFMTLATASGKPVMKKPAIAVVNANQVYLPLTDDMPSLANYTFNEEDITGIVGQESRAESQESMVNGQSTYDLQGRKVSGTVKGGIYIRNHHKILQK